jgi:hypothetical protein
MKTVNIEKDQPRWMKGTWLGITDHTNEHIIGTEDGFVKCRAIHPREESQRWNADAMMKIRGSPWKPNPNRKSLRITTRIVTGDDDESEVEGEDPDKDPEVASEEFEIKVDSNEDEDRIREDVKQAKHRERFEARYPRSLKMYIMKGDVFKDGATPKCGGCKLVLGERKNMSGHSRECKVRIMEAMREDVEDAKRVEKDEAKTAKKNEE